MLALAEVVEELRAELSRAMVAGEGQPLRFEVADVLLELRVGVEREASGKGGVRFWVFELGGEARAQSESTQTVTLTLRPKLAATGEAPAIAGETVTGED
jgi:hypothetical protein